MPNFLGLKTMTSAFLAPDTIYARDGETLRKFIWTANALADQEREIESLRRKVHDLTAEVTFGVAAEKAKADEARSHVSRLEESLRVALEARAEAVEVLGKVAPALDYCIEELEAFGWLDKDEHVRAARSRLARAIGGAK